MVLLLAIVVPFCRGKWLVEPSRAEFAAAAALTRAIGWRSEFSAAAAETPDWLQPLGFPSGAAQAMHAGERLSLGGRKVQKGSSLSEWWWLRSALRQQVASEKHATPSSVQRATR